MKNVYTMDLEISKKGVVEFPMASRWLKGEEYGFLLRHYRAYSQILEIYDCFKGFQPDYVYESPSRNNII